MEHRSIYNAIMASGLVLLSLFVRAQNNSQPLTLDEALNAALTNNKHIQLAELDEHIAASKYKQTQAIFLPQAGFSYTAIRTNHPLNTFGFKLQQQSIKQNDFNPEVLNNPSSSSNVMTKVDIQQPLLNLDLLYMQKGVARQIELYQLKTLRTKEYIQFEVQKAFLQLQLAYEGVSVLEESLHTSGELYTFINNRVTQGLLQQSDALNAQVQVKTIESNLAEAKSNIGNASDYISFLMGRPYGTIYKVQKSNDSAAVASGIPAIVPENRADFGAMKKAIESAEWMIKSQKLSYLPRLNAFGTYQLNDKTLTGFGSKAYLAGIQLSWNIFDGNRRRNTMATQALEKQKLVQQLSEQQVQSQLELNKTVRQLEDASFRMQQQQAAVAYASDALRIIKNRHEQGLVNTTDVLMAQTQHAQQQLGLAQAVFNYNLTHAYLKFLTTSSQ
jgi:outer membrane protein TolC